MASFYSTPANFNTYVQPYDTKLIGTVLSAKQQKYDTNVAKTEQLIGQIGNLDLIREQDREYLYDRVTEGIGDPENTSKMDWSNSGVVRNYTNNLMSIIDDKVLDSVVSTKNFRNFQTQVQKYREQDNGAQYSDRNVQYSMYRGGVNNWLQGQTDKLNQVNYIPYSDVGAKLEDFSKNLDKYADVVHQTSPDGNGYFVTKKGKRLTEDEIRQQVTALLSPEEKQQMNINAWYNYDRGIRTPNEIKEDFSKFRDTQIANIESKLNDLQVDLKNTHDNRKKTELQNRISQYQKRKQDTYDTYNGWIEKGDVDNMTSNMEYDNVIGGFARAFAFDNVQLTYSADSAFEAQQRLLYTQRKDALKAAKELEGANIQTTPIPKTDWNEFNATERLIDETDKLDGDFKNTVNAITNQLPQDVKLSIDTGYSAARKAALAKGIELSKEDYTHEWLTNKAKEGAGIITKTQAIALDNAKIMRDDRMKTLNTSIDRAAETAEAQLLPNLVEGYLNNPSTQVIINGSTMSGREYLESNGITNAEALQNNPEVADWLIKNYYREQINSGATDPIYFSRLAQKFGESPTGLKRDERTLTQRATLPDIPSWAERVAAPAIAGVNAAGRWFTEINPVTSWAFEGDRTDYEKSVETAPATTEFLRRGKESGAYAQRIGGVIAPESVGYSNSITNVPGLSDGINTSKVSAEAGKYIMENTGTSYENVVRIAPGSETYESLANLVMDPNVVDGSFKIDRKTPLSIKAITTDEIQISQVDPKGGEPKIAVVLRPQIPATVASQVDFSRSTPIFRQGQIPEIESQVSYNSKADTRTIRDMTSALRITEQQAWRTTKEQYRTEKFGTINRDVLGTWENPTNLGNIVKQIVDSEDFYVKIEEELGTPVIRIVNRRNGVERDIPFPSSPIPADRLSNTYFNVKYAPQIFLDRMVDNMITTSKTDPEGYNDVYDVLSEIYADVITTPQ